jgi:hypothetical protein
MGGGATVWRKSKHSGGSDCVQWRRTSSDVVLVRDSKDPSGPVLSFTHSEWRAFVAGVKDGEADLPE